MDLRLVRSVCGGAAVGVVVQLVTLWLGWRPEVPVGSILSSAAVAARLYRGR